MVLATAVAEGGASSVSTSRALFVSPWSFWGTFRNYLLLFGIGCWDYCLLLKRGIPIQAWSEEELCTVVALMLMLGLVVAGVG